MPRPAPANAISGRTPVCYTPVRRTSCHSSDGDFSLSKLNSFLLPACLAPASASCFCYHLQIMRLSFWTSFHPSSSFRSCSKIWLSSLVLSFTEADLDSRAPGNSGTQITTIWNYWYSMDRLWDTLAAGVYIELWKSIKTAGIRSLLRRKLSAS